MSMNNVKKRSLSPNSAEPQNKKQHGLVNDGILVEDQAEAMSEAEMKEALEKLSNQERFLSDDTFFRRLAPADPDPYPVTADEKTQNFTVERMFICQRFGGGARDTFPEPKAEKLAKHGYNNLVCINLEYAPYAP
ncbi:hypothetical protein AcV7_007754 [Taiwanofungus camphoratus]|nr:hypothetical protein AcV7_007754 [Antrodia cinnamomea]